LGLPRLLAECNSIKDSNNPTAKEGIAPAALPAVDAVTKNEIVGDSDD